MGITLPCVEVLKVSKHYPNCVALDEISFRVDQGEVVGVVGPNGAGKTTLLKLVAGLTRPTKGTIKVLGHSSVEEPLKVKEVVGFIPEEDALYEDMTVREYLMFFADLFSLKRDVAERTIQKGLEHFSLEPKERIGGLSKGTKRRVSIIRSLIHDPAVLVYDEPTAGLDIFSRKEIDEEMMRLRNMGKSIIISSHDLSHIEEVCDRVIILFDGKVSLDSDVGELLAHQLSSGYVVHFLGPERSLSLPNELRIVQRRGRLCSALAMSEDEIGPLSRRISELGGRVLGASRSRGSLENEILQRARDDGESI